MVRRVTMWKVWVKHDPIKTQRFCVTSTEVETVIVDLIVRGYNKDKIETCEFTVELNKLGVAMALALVPNYES